MWHGRLRPDLNACSSIDYKHERSAVESELMKGVSPAYARQSHLQRPSDSYSGDLREALTGLFAKESHHGETRSSAEEHRYDFRDSSSGSSYLDDLRSTISKSSRAVELNTYGESQSGTFDRDLRNMISGTNMRVTSTGSNEVETAHSRDNASSYYSRILDSSGRQIRELSNMGYPGKNSSLDQFARNSQETINDKDFSFLTSTFKTSADPKLSWSKGSNVFSDSLAEHKKQIPEDKFSYQQQDSKISQAASCLLENSRLLMSLNQNPSHGSLSSVRSQDVTPLSHSHLLASSGLGVNLQANLYPGKELMMINSLQTPIVVSTPLQIMEAAAAAAANKTVGSSGGGSFWDSLKKEGLLSYQKTHAKSVPEELDVTDVVGEDFQMPDLSAKRSTNVNRSRSISPVRHSHASSRRSPDRRRTPPLDRDRRSASPRQKYDRSGKGSRGLQRDISSRQSRITTGKHSLSKDERVRSRSPERMSGHKRRSREVSPCRTRERSPRGARSRSPCWGRLSPSRVREMSPRRSKNVLRCSRDMSPQRLKEIPSRRLKDLSPHQLREVSPRQYRETSPQLTRQMSSQRYRDQSPRHYHNISPPRVREMSPWFQRARSPQRARELSPHRLREHSPQRSREFSPRRSRAFSPSRAREFSPHRLRELAPRRSREFSPIRSREFSPKRSREFSPKRSREFSPKRSREFSPQRSRDFSPRRSREFSPRRSRELSPRMQRERSRVTRGLSPGILRERSPLLTRDSSQHSKERDRYINQRVRDSPMGDLMFSREHSPRTTRRHSREISPGRLMYRRAHSKSPRFDRERSTEHFRGSSSERVKRFSLERDRGYSPVPVRVLSPERPSHQQRGCSPVSLRSLSPESVRRYPLEPQVRRSPEYRERSSSRVMRSAEEDVESPRRSWDSRLNPKRNRIRRRIRRGGRLHKFRGSENSPDTSQEYHRESSIDLPRDQVRKTTPVDQGKEASAISQKRETTRAGQSKETPISRQTREALPISKVKETSVVSQVGESKSIDLAREASPISMTSNDDKEFGARSRSPLFDEVSLSPRSTRASSPGTPTSDEKPKPVLHCDDLPRGSPVSVADFSEDRCDEDGKSVDLHRDLSPVSLEEHVFDDAAADAKNNRAGSPVSDDESLIVTDSIDAQDSPTEADGDKEGEDLRVQILRLREEKVERRLKKLDEESKETELRLQNLSPELLDYSPMRDTPSPLLDECDNERRPEQGNRKFYGY